MTPCGSFPICQLEVLLYPSLNFFLEVVMMQGTGVNERNMDICRVVGNTLPWARKQILYFICFGAPIISTTVSQNMKHLSLSDGVKRVLTSPTTEVSELGVIGSKDAAAHFLQFVQVQSIIPFGILQQHDPL